MRGRTSGTLSDEAREKSGWEEELWGWIGLNPTLLVYTEGGREGGRRGRERYVQRGVCGLMATHVAESKTLRLSNASYNQKWHIMYIRTLYTLGLPDHLLVVEQQI